MESPPPRRSPRQASNGATDYEYDGQGRLIRTHSSTDGIPTLHVDYADGTSLRTGWDQSETVFEFHAARDGAATLVGNGRMQIEIERDDLGGVVAFRSGTRSVLFERDHLGRIVDVRHVDGSAVRYSLDALGYRTLSEFGGGVWRRVAVDGTGNVVALENTDTLGRRQLSTAHLGGGVRMVEVSEGQLDHFNQLRVLTGGSRNRCNPTTGQWVSAVAHSNRNSGTR